MTTVYVCSNPKCYAVWATDPKGHCPACSYAVEAGLAGWSTMAAEVRTVPSSLPAKCDGGKPPAASLAS